MLKRLNQQKFCLLFWCPSIGEQKINQVVASRAFPFNLAFLCIFPLLISYFLHLFYETLSSQREAILIMRLFENFNPSCIIIKVRINKEGVEAQKSLSDFKRRFGSHVNQFLMTCFFISGTLKCSKTKWYHLG